MYKFLMHRRHPAYRLVTKADAPFPSGASEDEWHRPRSRDGSEVNAEARTRDAHRGGV